MPKKLEKANIVFLSMEGLLPGTAACTHVTAIAEGLKARGYFIDVVADRANDYRSASLIARSSRYLRLAATVWAKRNKTDLLYIRSHFAAAPLAMVMRRAGVPIVVEVNGLVGDMITTYKWLRAVRRLLVFAEKRLFDSALAMVCVTSDLAQRVGEQTRIKAVHIGNGVDCSRFRPIDQAVPPYAIFFGSLAAWHGVRTLLAAFKHDKWPKDLHLVVAGNGQFSAEVQAVAAQDYRLNYAGLVDPADMPALIGASAIGISPIELLKERGLTEVAPLKLMEMLACNLPVVASRVEGQTELTEQAGGRTFTPGDVQHLAETVADLWSDPKQLERARMLARQVGEKLDWSMIVRRIDLEVIEPILKVA